MKSTISTLFRVFFAGLLAIAIGCGGSTSSGGGGTANGKFALYATDSLDGNDQVWVTVYKVTINGGAAATTVFEEPAGRVIDLKSLRDATGAKFAFFGLPQITPGTYTGASVTMGKDLTIVTKGASSGMTKQFADSLDDGVGKTTVTFAFSGSKELGRGDDKLIIDFDLKNWVESAGKIMPVLKESNDSGINNEGRHNDEDYHGNIKNLTGTAPNQTFTLSSGPKDLFIVKTNSKTVIFNSSDSTSPTLTEGARVEVRGVFLTAKGSMTAISIKLENENGGEGRSEARGIPDQIDAAAGTFAIKLRECDNFLPFGPTVNIATTALTTYRSERGVTMTKDEFFTALKLAKIAKAEGTFDKGTNTITARRCKLYGHGEGGNNEGEAEGKGEVSALDLGAGTFEVSLTEWEGFSSTVGTKIKVTTSDKTVYRGKNGDTVDKASFFAQIEQYGNAEVKGTYAEGTIVATRCKVED